MTEEKNSSSLNQKEGVEQPASINPELVRRLKTAKNSSADAIHYFKGIQSRDRKIISQAITLIESQLPGHRQLAQEIIELCLPLSGQSYRLGITGVPGVGKSTFIEAFGLYLIEQGHKVAVLAIDPSSSLTKGSILGDKTRMEKLSVHPDAYIRPSSSAGTLGGVSRNTRESIFLFEAAGYDIIIVETVGVGQSETSVHQMVDMFILLMLAGAGDELQGIKKGIMEMADALIINKADGDNIEAARRAKATYENALHLFPPGDSGWLPRVLTCSSLHQQNMVEVWKLCQEYLKQCRSNGFFEAQRAAQMISSMDVALDQLLDQKIHSNEILNNKRKYLEKEIIDGKMSPYKAAENLFNDFIQLLVT